MTLVPALLDGMGRNSSVSPPPNYRPLGRYDRVEIVRTNVSIGSGRTKAQRAGLRYEGKVQRYILRHCGENYKVSPQIEVSYHDVVLRSLIPDGLFLADDLATVVEIKRQHMPESWWQLRKLYGPVVEALPGITHVNLLSIVGSFDPAMPYPEEIIRTDDIKEFVSIPQSKIGVLWWR